METTTTAEIRRIIRKEVAKATKTIAPAHPDEWLTPLEVMAILKISRSKLNQYKNTGAIPYYAMNGAKTKRFKRSDIEKVMRSVTIVPDLM